MDLDLRTLETRDPGSAALIQARLRTGELTQAHVELAASLGHAGALELEPGTDQVDWGDWNCRFRTIILALDLLDGTLPKRVAEDWARRALPHMRATARSYSDAAEGRSALPGTTLTFVPGDPNKPAAAAATAASYASEAETVEAVGAKREWQRLRLAAYVLRETE